MATIFSLPRLSEFDNGALQRAVAETPRAKNLRTAVLEVIRALHGLPDAMGCDLSKLDVYIGRAGATAGHLRQRWLTRYSEFDAVPSASALVIVRGQTSKLMEEGWETKAQRLIEALKAHNGLCCANARIGTQGRRPDSKDTVIYMVARTKRGPAGAGPSIKNIAGAMISILEHSELDDEVARTAAVAIPRHEDATEHEIAEPPEHEATEEEPGLVCKECESRPAMPHNRGCCGWCRRVPVSDRCRWEGCRNRRLESNYGFCGHHRGRA
jgi:hypothetical protein